MNSAELAIPETVESFDEDLKEIEAEFERARLKLLEAKRRRAPEKVEDYTFIGAMGENVPLSALFGARDELILIHNMGKRCPYCTLWADGLNGLVKHFENRAAFVLTSPDDHETQSKFARDRGWTFRMFSTKGSTFTHDMGYEPTPNTYWPGVSFFRKDPDGSIYRTARDVFGPGDLYCSIWHMLDLLPSGPKEWEPRYHYD